MTERNEMPTPVPEYLRAAACKYIGAPAVTPYTDWGKGGWPYAVCELLWERGEREPVDPDLIEAREIVAKWHEANPVKFPACNPQGYRLGMRDDIPEIQQALLCIKRGRELAEAKP